VSVLVADSHQPIRAGVRSALVGTEFSVVTEAFTATTAVHEARRSSPDIALLSVAIPGGGISAAAQIRQALPNTRIVMLSASDDRDDLLGALRAGAHGYLLKNIDPARLAPALRGVLQGEAPIPRALVATLAEEMFLNGADSSASAEQGEGLLTAREREILDLLAAKLSTSQIADRLLISAVTVRSHIATIRRKLNAVDREAAVRMVRAERPAG
jgi:two-component system NarL family response regulator